jgi:hypothetical protein
MWAVADLSLCGRTPAVPFLTDAAAGIVKDDSRAIATMSLFMVELPF